MTKTNINETAAAQPENDGKPINDWANKYNITASFEFVPFSKSRNSEQKTPSLNWKVTLKRGDREFMRFDYSQGCGHAPSYNAKNLSLFEKQSQIKHECETGKFGRYSVTAGMTLGAKQIAPPKLADVLYSISMDSDALNYSSFEDWAATFGYEPDSRSAEAIYKTCLEYALKMRGAVGETAMSELQTATQDY